MKNLRLLTLLVQSVFAFCFAAAFVFLPTTNNIGLGQAKQGLCESNQVRRDELEKQALTLQKELSYTPETETNARKVLGIVNKAIVDPQRRGPGKFLTAYADSLSDKRGWLDELGVQWKDEYGDDDVRFLQALRDGEVQQVERIKYVLAHKSEMTQQKADVDRQIASQKKLLTEQGCNDDQQQETGNSALSVADWQKAIGTWENEARDMVLELVDVNKASREYGTEKDAKIEGYVRKVPPKWPDKIHVGDLVFISKKVSGNTISGIYIQAAPKGTCPNLPLDWSGCSFTVAASGKTLTSSEQTKLFWTPKCEWSDQTAANSFTLHRIK